VIRQPRLGRVAIERPRGGLAGVPPRLVPGQDHLLVGGSARADGVDRAAGKAFGQRVAGGEKRLQTVGAQVRLVQQRKRRIALVEVSLRPRIDRVIGFRGRPDAITPFLGKTRHEGVDVYDNTLAVLEYPNGPSTVRVSSVEVNGYGRRQFVVLGTKGSIEIKPFERPTVVTYAEGGGGDIYCDRKRVIELPSMGGRYDELLLDFARCVRGEKENPFGYEHELLVHKATLKASGFEDVTW